MASDLAKNIVDTYRQRPNVAILMSLGGSNAKNILEDEEIRDLYNITTIMTDRSTSGAGDIAASHGLDLVSAYASRFHDNEDRRQYFDDLSLVLGKRGVQVCFYAGFMKITAGRFINRLPGINAHPADLTNTDSYGVPKFRGMDAINLMRLDTDGMVGTSVHAVDHTVDAGDTFIRSLPFQADKGLSNAECHSLVKPIEHKVYPLALKMLGQRLLSLEQMPYTFDPSTESLCTIEGEIVQ